MESSALERVWLPQQKNFRNDDLFVGHTARRATEERISNNCFILFHIELLRTKKIKVKRAKFGLSKRKYCWKCTDTYEVTDKIWTSFSDPRVFDLWSTREMGEMVVQW